MRQIILFVCFFFTFNLFKPVNAQVLWQETFSVPNKGYWVNEAAVLQSDLSEVQWSLNIGNCNFIADNDYAKTVSTSGGRFEVLDSDGEVFLYSPVIDISKADAVNVSFSAGETGSSVAVDKKYVKAFVIVDGKPEVPLTPDSVLSGNWGDSQFLQKGITGKSLQLLVKMNSSYSSDKVYIDNILVEAIDSSRFLPKEISLVGVPSVVFAGDTFLIQAKCLDGFGEVVIDSALELQLSANGLHQLNQHVEDGVYSWRLICSIDGTYIFNINDSSETLSSAVGSVMVYNRSDVLMKEDYEDYSPNSSSLGQWEISTVEPVAGAASVKHVLQQESGSSVLEVAKFDSMDMGGAEFLFSFKLKNGKWDPSSSNTFYLFIGDGKDSLDQNGYAVGVNASGSSDLVSLWRIANGVVAQKITETSFDWGENTSASIAVSRSPLGEWTLTVADLQTDVSVLAKGNDVTFRNLTTVDLNFTFSQTRSGQLWFDDLLILRKNTPPIIETVKVLADGRLLVAFNEAIDTTILNSGNFKVEALSGEDFNVDNIEFQNQYEVIVDAVKISEPQLTISALNVADLEGERNSISSKSINYQLPAEKYDVVFTEIMADPSPVVGLPEAEYLEIFNRSSKYIDLQGWKLVAKTSEFVLTEYLISPNESLILCDVDDSATFSGYGKVLAVKSFPSLLNSASYLGLISSENVLVDELTYSDEWYSDSDKDNGGWSLEKIDPDRNCGNQLNWKASADSKGGTPGAKNSIDSENIDAAAPELVSLRIVSPNQIELFFNEAIDTIFFSNVADLEVEGLSVDSIHYFESGLKANIYLNAVIESNVQYQLIIDQLADGCGNIGIDYRRSFSRVTLGRGDILINEVLFNPFAGGVDFVELYNNTNVAIDLQGLKLSTRNDSLGLRSVCEISQSNLLFPPKSILAFTANPDGVSSFYAIPYPERLVQMGKFPPLNNDQGRVVLLDNTLAVIDEFYYNEEMHSAWLADVEGVSLERLSADGETNDARNWHSASSLAGFATPGCENSQKEEQNGGEEKPLSVELLSEVVSPNGDGNNDELIISFNTDEAGYLANVFVFDALGREVYRLMNNDLFGASDKVVFDLRKNNGEILPMGVYVLYCELVHNKGVIQVLKKAFLVTDKQ